MMAEEGGAGSRGSRQAEGSRRGVSETRSMGGLFIVHRAHSRGAFYWKSRGELGIST